MYIVHCPSFVSQGCFVCFTYLKLHIGLAVVLSFFSDTGLMPTSLSFAIGKGSLMFPIFVFIFLSIHHNLYLK